MKELDRKLRENKGRNLWRERGPSYALALDLPQEAIERISLETTDALTTASHTRLRNVRHDSQIVERSWAVEELGQVVDAIHGLPLNQLPQTVLIETREAEYLGLLRVPTSVALARASELFGANDRILILMTDDLASYADLSILRRREGPYLDLTCWGNLIPDV